MAGPELKHYRAQHGNCRRRGIQFRLTFAEWARWWRQTRRYHLRGPGPGQYSMARLDPRRPYELGNLILVCNPQGSERYWAGPCGARARRRNRQQARDRQRSVQTPQGSYPSVGQAARALGLSPSGLRWRIQHHPDDYHYRQ